MLSLLASLVALVLAWAAAAKLVRFRAWSSALEGYALPRPLETLARFTVPPLEAGAAALLFTGFVTPGAILALALASAFAAAVLRARGRVGRRLPCGCFGGRRERDYRGMLALDTALAAGAALVLVGGRGAAPAHLDASTAAPGLLAVLGVGLAAWVARQATAAMRG